MSVEPDRMISTRPASPQESEFERSLRPGTLAEYVGQDKVRSQLEIFIAAARGRGEALDHVLLFGPPGLGKTTLAHIIARELGVNLRQTSGPVLERPGDLAAILTNLEPKDVLFIDEIHRLAPVVEEILYPALEDFQIDIMIGEGPAARSIKLDLPPFTLAGATTRAGMLTNPLRDRFGIVARLEFYSEQELAKIVQRSARLLKVPLEQDGAAEIARRSRGTPRVANRLLRRVRDYAQVKGDGTVSKPVAEAALKMLDVDALGLDMMDRKLLLAVIEKFGGGPVGLDNVAHAARAHRHAACVSPFRNRCARGGEGLAVRYLKIPVRVYYQDTDAGGVVFHGQYLAFMERARSELLNEAGIELARFVERHGILVMVHDIHVIYHLPARLNELLSVSAEVVKMGRASFVFHQRVERGAELLVEADVTIALVDRKRMKPARMPAELEQALSK